MLLTSNDWLIAAYQYPCSPRGGGAESQGAGPVEADLLTRLPGDLAVQAQALPVDALHVGRGVVGGDQPCGVPGASYSQ